MQTDVERLVFFFIHKLIVGGIGPHRMTPDLIRQQR
ncbi:Uncharacterised protein [Enterobacter cloacae]|nr:Uncharacterised protein [Enterobacter cloacae]